MSALANTTKRDHYTRAANDDCIKGRSRTRTKYGYDALDRLTSATTSAITDGWTYDANGNRLTQTGTTAITFSVASASNQLTATSGGLVRSYTYDAAGNTQTEGTSFSYNDRGRMASTSGGSTTYLYNALGQMTEKSGTLGTTILMQDEAGHVIGEYSSTGALVEETIWLGDIPVATLQPNGSGGVNIFYVHTDHLNTPRKVSRPSDNQLEWRWDADPFGTTAANQNPAGLGTFGYNLRFPGQYYQAETGLNQNYRRDYDSAVGGYSQSDPIGLLGGRNTYAYVGANPISRRDPLGLKIVVNGDSTDYNTAAAYLNQDSGMAQIIKDLDSSSTIYNILYITDGNDRYDPRNHTVYWDPRSALHCTSGGRQTPALGLGHELAHADASLWDRLIGWFPWGDYDNLEEWRVITGPETSAAQTLGEGIRTDHGGTPYDVTTPTGR